MAEFWRPVLRVCRDPLIWFLLAGLALFLAQDALESHDDRLIVIGPSVVGKLTAQWQGQTGRPPTPDEMQMLLASHIEEEILVREAMHLELDQNDVIIRRRLAQKTEFFLKDSSPLEQPDPATLRAFYTEHIQRYQRPATFSFRHVFTDSEDKARALLSDLAQPSANWRSLGQPFMLNREYANRSAASIDDLFGGGFAARLSDLKPSTGWSLPIRSGFGWHLVQITHRRPPVQRTFEQVADRVLFDWQQAQSDALAADKWAELRSRYRVEIRHSE